MTEDDIKRLKERLDKAENIIYDLLLQDDGQAYDEARKYFYRFRPDLKEMGR